MEPPEIRYAWNGEISLAYQVLGDGPSELVYLQGLLSNVELNWENPSLARFLRELSRVSRVVATDRRGLGCSERFTPTDTAPIEVLMDDLAAVLAASGCERPVVFATGDCGYIASLFASTYPERLTALILYGTSATPRRTEETPWARTEELMEEQNRAIRDAWGTGAWMQAMNPSLADREPDIHWGSRYERLSLTPGAVYAEGRRFLRTDIRGVVPSIHAPTLVLHRTGDPAAKVEGGRYLASLIPGARFVEVPGTDHFPWVGNYEAILSEITGFLDTLRMEEAELDRVLATVLFTDVVGSTTKAAELGDRGWGELIGRHDATVRALLARYRGKEISTAGDGFFASFDGPARAVRFARALVAALKPLGLEIRAGLHTGEVNVAGGQVRGIAVNIGARVGAAAGASEVLVSATVKDLVAGSDLVFEDRGTHRLKGVPGEWHLYAAVD